MLLKGKKFAIFNIANKRSIAWAIAKEMDAHGAELILGYQSERTKDTVVSLLEELEKPPLALVACDVTSDEQLAAARDVAGQFGKIDGFVHCLAYAPRECLEEPFLQTSRENFWTALNISAYSLVGMSQAFRPILKNEASIIALSYFGAEKVMPNYNVMGVAKAALEASVRYLAYDLGVDQIRVNAISAGPVNTLAARGVSGFLGILDLHEKRAPLRRNVEACEVADTAVFFASKLSSGITGEIMHVDTGYNIMGM